MTGSVTIPVWLFVLILLFAAVTFASHFLFPSVRWFFRRRLERAVKRLNENLQRPIEPFKLARRHDMIQRLSYDPDVMAAVVEHARKEGVPEAVAFEQAKRYAREIVPSFSAFVYFGLAIRLARFIGTSLYRVRVAHIDEDAMQAVDPEAAVVFVMNHRSNVDYVLVTYMAAERSALAYAVGEWARIWPLSRLIRAMGAYFIRRKIRNELYRRVLASYVRLATQAGVTQAMFPEGGLSLNGGLAPPKLGLLKYIRDAYTPEGRDVVFVPVALNYDRVLEDQILISAAQKGERRFKARISTVMKYWGRMLWRRLRGRYHKFGYAAVSFGTPLSLRQYMSNNPGAKTHNLANALMDRVSTLVPILPVPFVAWMVLQRGQVSRAELEASLDGARDHLHDVTLRLARNDVAYTVEYGLRNLLQRKMLVETETGYAAAPGKDDTLRFYANSIDHLMTEHGHLFCGCE
ncbi:MAG: 1-acyl-sn-glycerol-3-phosphate acyltransferase [Paracoccaceae bacterium]